MGCTTSDLRLARQPKQRITIEERVEYLIRQPAQFLRHVAADYGIPDAEWKRPGDGGHCDLTNMQCRRKLAQLIAESIHKSNIPNIVLVPHSLLPSIAAVELTVQALDWLRTESPLQLRNNPAYFALVQRMSQRFSEAQRLDLESAMKNVWSFMAQVATGRIEMLN